MTNNDVNDGIAKYSKFGMAALIPGYQRAIMPVFFNMRRGGLAPAIA
jgi:hypothetical protein